MCDKRSEVKRAWDAARHDRQPQECGHCRLADARQVADALIKFDAIYANEIDPTPRPDWLVGALEAAQRLRA